MLFSFGLLCVTVLKPRISYGSGTWVWTSIHHLAGMNAVPARLEDVVSFLQPIAHQRTVKRSWADIRDIIITMVRLKLFTLKFKNKERVIKLLAEWKMPKNFRLYGD
ncbi:hypothetical protein Tco_1284877 [Tanacetum coccineum]